MNERIRELAEQANPSFKQFYITGPWHSVDIEKFAELIVKECIEQVDKVDAMLEDNKEKAGVAWVGLVIAKHFGVE